MLQNIIDWLGFGARGHSADHHMGHGHQHGDGEAHGHTHGVIDPTIATTERGIWAIKWSFIILAITAAMQIVVVIITGSVALFADTIHNIGDAATAIPLWIAFLFARKKANDRFTYGYGKVEDIAGVIIVGLILFSALVAGWESIDRLLNPREINFLWAVAFAGIVGFIGNEVVAVFRIRVGREIQSAALIADGYHARVDGLTSLAVVLGAIGVGIGFPLADPIVGLIITVMIFGIVWQSARAVFTRLLDGVDAGITAELRHSIEHVPGIVGIDNVRARWLGHRLHAEADIALSAGATVAEGIALTKQLRATVGAHLPALTSLRIGFTDPDSAHAHAHEQGHDHAHHDNGAHGHDNHGHDDHAHPHDAHGEMHEAHEHEHPHQASEGMETFIVNVTAKHGHEDAVADFYRKNGDTLKTAPGFQGRKIYQAKAGAHVAAVRRHYTEEELAKHPEPPHHHPGTQFIVIEFWDNADARMNFSKNRMSNQNQAALFPHLEPAHSHEFFKEISGE